MLRPNPRRSRILRGALISSINPPLARHASLSTCTPRVSPNGNFVAFTYAPKTATQKMLEGGREHPGPQYRHMTRLGYKLDGHGYWDDAWMHLYVLDVRGVLTLKHEHA